jgi:hypothetical protein
MKEVLPPSLLPYLQYRKKHFRIEISLNSREASYLEESPFPFLLINDSTPFERLLEAKIVTDAGSNLKRVFLLQQSDNYHHVPDEMWPLTNKDIDQHWRNTIEFYSSQSTVGNSNPILLAEQTQKNGEYSQFQSLFYCAFKDVYFHPPCPQCGDFLHLCCDDTLLAESNLPAYTTSLKRYLYCPKCQQVPEKEQFYAYSREGNDTPALKDRRHLVNDFGNLILKSETLNSFPCMNCPELTACYGTDNRVMSRIVPYSFYPFHVLIFEADTMSAPDFLALIAGASFEALKENLAGKQAHGRLRCLQAYEHTRPTHSNFMFGGDSEKDFLEILYLKLSFLGELISEFFSNSTRAVYCDASLSLDRVWVRVADQAGLLPQFWNFNLSILDIWSDLSHQPHLSKYPPAYGHHFLGTIWFYALLVNNHQSVEDVRAELDRHLAAFSVQDQVFSQNIQTEGAGTVFAPENIFWNPASKQVGEKWHHMWRRSLDIGGAMLAAAFQSEHKWSPDEFWLDYNSLRTDIKMELFGQAPTTTPVALVSEDPAIADILIRLHAKWRREKRPAATPLTENNTQKVILPGPQETEAPAETLILSPGAQLKTSLSSDRPTAGEETLILPSNNRPHPPNPATPSSDDELIQETVILSPGNSAPKPPGFDSINTDMGQENDLPETVVLSPGRSPGGGADNTARTFIDNNLTNTRQQPGGDKIQPPMGAENKEGSPQDDDILTETVILRPGKDKGLQDE